jgi:predicted PhzF superfamily epimerase YddE/YHI9
MRHSRRSFLQTAGAVGAAATLGKVGSAPAYSNADLDIRRFQCVQIDVFTSRRLEGNPLVVFLDARGLSDDEMQDLTRETNLQETTFVFPRDAVTKREQGSKVRIFVPNEEIPFAGHPTLGTAMVLRSLHLASKKPTSAQTSDASEITLDLKVGKISVHFRTEPSASLERCAKSIRYLAQSMIGIRSRACSICRPETFPAMRRSRHFPLACSS